MPRSLLRPRPGSRARSARVAALVLLMGLLGCAPAVTAAAAATATAAPGGTFLEGHWPLEPAGDIVHLFDPPAAPWGAGHRGVDLAGRVGQRVRTSLPGTVSFAGRVAGVGVVVVDHGRTRTTYQPVLSEVARGDVVDAGEVLGWLGWQGSHCLPRACLHWGWRRGEEYLDPLELLGGGPRPVRLFPVPARAPAGQARGWAWR